TGGGGRLDNSNKLPKNWIIDWTRFTGADPHDSGDGEPARLASRIDTELAPPLHTLFKEGEDQAVAREVEMFVEVVWKWPRIDGCPDA
ncbi:hypothetical protein ACC690_38040, partial [Rhizobium johnstonii]